MSIPKPARIAALPVDARGFPVPWFASWFDADGKPTKPGQGTPNFVHPLQGAPRLAARRNSCWICGQKLGIHMAFVIGPMCVLNRISSEPPSHLDCARYAVQACPFLTQPRMRRLPRPEGGGVELPGIMVARNPGVSMIWVTRSYRLEEGLFHIGTPESVEWWKEARAATREEVEAAITSGLPEFRKHGAPEDWIVAQQTKAARWLPAAAIENPGVL